jgi:putative transposase
MRYPASEKFEIIRIVEQSHLSARRTLDQIVGLALEETELSPRELAVRFTDTKD